MLTVLLGGARSGKSSWAETTGRRAQGTVTYLATCPRIPGDTDLDERIERHRSDRPASWTTLEEDVDLAGAIGRAEPGHLIIDCLTLWVNNLQFQGRTAAEIHAASTAALTAVAGRIGDTVAVSNEVGSGIVPSDPATRAYRDLLGRINQQWAAAADRVLFLAAGRAIALHDPDDFLR